MRNIFLFIRRYFVFILFVFLQGFSIYLITHYSRYHKAVFTNTSNQISGKINKQYNKVEYYFQLKKTNDSLVAANENLYNKLRQDFLIPDTVKGFIADTIKIDSLEKYRRFEYFKAKVVYNSVAAQNNYVIIDRGFDQQVKEGMGIIDPNMGVVGIVTESSKDFSVVMSLLHKDSHISGKLQKGGEVGTLSWDGKTPNLITLSGIPKSAKVLKGDTVITSGFSTSFPKGMKLGYVEQVVSDKGTSNYIIKFRSAANFYNIEFVYAIDNKQAGEINTLLDKLKKNAQ